MSQKWMVLDTETSGLFDFKLPADDPSQPRLAGASIILLDAIDAEPVEYSFLVKPDGWEMTAEAAEVNGLTTEMLLAKGLPVSHVLDFYEAKILEGYHMAAYNAQFDGKMMRGEFRRASRDDLFEKTPNVCLMRAMMSAMKGQRPAGSKGFPKLAEAAAFVGHTIESPHQDAGRGDARAALAILRWLLAADQLPEARIHYAKDKPEA